MQNCIFFLLQCLFTVNIVLWINSKRLNHEHRQLGFTNNGKVNIQYSQNTQSFMTIDCLLQKFSTMIKQNMFLHFKLSKRIRICAVSRLLCIFFHLIPIWSIMFRSLISVFVHSPSTVPIIYIKPSLLCPKGKKISKNTNSFFISFDFCFSTALKCYSTLEKYCSLC